MNEIAQWAAKERAELFQETAARKGLNPVIIEKDFWVCWALSHLFQMQGRPALLFKGGTSLSKIYKAIGRFSEDIDLAFDRKEMGFTDKRDPANPELTGKQRKALVLELREACAAKIVGPYSSAVRADFGMVLGKTGWELRVDELDPDGQTLLFAYPSALAAEDYGGVAYIQPAVKLEFGARSDHTDVGRNAIRPYAAEEFPEQFATPLAELDVQSLKRTFWEKAAILHQRSIRGFSSGVSRQSRHYSDLAALADGPAKTAALSDLALLQTVANHHATFFPLGGDPYRTAQPGTLRLIPRDEDVDLLTRDYDAMRPMFFRDPPSFADVLKALDGLAKEINGEKAP